MIGRAVEAPLRDGRANADMRSGRPTVRAPMAGARSLMMMLLLLAAFIGQSIVTQSHIHFARNTGLAGAVIGSNGSVESPPTPRRGPQDSPADCPVCHELAAAGHYLLPEAVTFAATAVFAAWFYTLPATAVIGPQRSHRWQSRAPPR